MKKHAGLEEEPSFREAVDLLGRSRRLTILTGAGVSVESGIPDFRSAEGLWERYNPMEFASAWGFKANPGGCWGLFFELGDMIAQSKPNPGHIAIAQLESQREAALVVTQNIDGLHQAAGSRRVLEFHGTVRSLTCPRCGSHVDAAGLDSLGPFFGVAGAMDGAERHPPTCGCGAILKPDIILFGDPIPPGVYQQSVEFLRSSEAVMVIGTSATVAPFSELPLMAVAEGIPLIEVNLVETGITELATTSIQGAAGTVLPALVNALGSRDPETWGGRL